jgi:tRNA-dihydrouridine synthase
MLARGSLGNPWLFEELLGRRATEPTLGEVLDELHWVMDRAVEHLGHDRGARYLRKFYPWYAPRLGLSKAQTDALTRTETVADARALLAGLRPARAA